MVTPFIILETQEKYPGLRHDGSRNVLLGELAFSACWHKDRRQLKREIPLDSNSREFPNFIEDSHSIEILLSEESRDLNERHPKVIASDVERIDHTVVSKSINLIDLHIYEDRSCCLMLGQPQLAELPLPSFIGNVVVPFFYRISYVERHGLTMARSELWGEYSHGAEGLRERSYESDLKNLKDIPRNAPCSCGSNLKFKRCCIKKFNAKQNIERDLQNAEQLSNARRHQLDRVKYI